MPDETAPAPQPVTSPPVTSPPVAPLPVTTLEGGELPDGLLDAVSAYEDALRRDDAAALADAF